MQTEAQPAGFVAALGIELWVDDGLTHGRAEIVPEMLAPGTDRPRVGVLATMVDVVAGFLPTGPVNPTVDLRVSLLADPPSSGSIELVCRPAKLGRRLFLGETLLHTGDPARPFARSTTTFMNEQIPGASGFGPPTASQVGATSFDELLCAQPVDDRTLEVELHPGVSNGPFGTMQGGAQALLAEVAAGHALATPGLAVTDLDIRYVNRVKSGPVAARADVVTCSGRGAHVRVELVDRGEDDRLVALVAVLAR